MHSVILKAGSGPRVRAFYPSVRRDEIESVQGNPEPGEVVRVLDTRGHALGQGFYNAGSHIPVRVLTTHEERVDADFFQRRLDAARARRTGRIAATNAWRVVNGESDGLPGLIVDCFGDIVVLQIRNAGMERQRQVLVPLLADELSPAGIYERSDVEARAEEGLEPRVGTVWGTVPPTAEVSEDDLRFTVNLAEGQKTGFYLDQRDNRRRLRSLVRAGDRVLDVYSYVGAFGLHAARAGAVVLCVDKDSRALTVAEHAARCNGVGDRVGVRWGDAVEVLGALHDERRRFTHIVLDPPTLVKRREDLARTRRLFVEIGTQAMQLLEPNGILFLSSCAFYVSAHDLLDVARQAADRAQRRVEVLDITYQPADHPWILQIAETLYLKTLIMRVE